MAHRKLKRQSRRWSCFREIFSACRRPAALLRDDQAAFLARVPSAGAASHLAACPWPVLRFASVILWAGCCRRVLTFKVVSLLEAGRGKRSRPE